MDAPLYRPATAFEQPRWIPVPLSSRGSAISEIMADPVAWAIVTTELPMVGSMITSPAMKPMLTTLSLRSLIQFGVTTPAGLDRIDMKLKALEAKR